MITRTYVLAAAVAALVPAMALADSTKVEVSYLDDGNLIIPMTDFFGNPLTAGTAADGDGAIIQIGYFSGVSISLDPADFTNEWAETFVPLTGLGSANPATHDTTVGDTGGGPDGFFFFDAVFHELPVNPPNVPSSGLPGGYPVRLGVRFYDGTTLESSTHYNTVSSFDSEWLLNAPVLVPSPLSSSTLDLDNDPLVWHSGLGGSYATVMPIPEPGSLLLALLTSLSLLAVRRRA